MNILLIDDDPDNLRILASILEINKHSCHTFTEPYHALDAYRQGTFDVVITDLIMPGMNGIQVLQRVRSLKPDAKVVIITGHMVTDSIIAALNNRAYAFLNKPLKIDDLMATLEKIEQENLVVEKVRREHARLALEYSRLKRSFKDYRLC